MKKMFNKLMIIAILLMTVSCIDEINTINTPNAGNGEKSVSIRVAVPYTAPQGATRAIGAEQENSIGTLSVLSFKVETDGTETFLYRSEAQRDGNTNGNSLQSFNVKLLIKDHHQRFVLIANADDEVKNLIGNDVSLLVGTKKEEMLAGLTFASLNSDGRWNVTNTGNYTKIPMWGESDKIIISANTTNISNSIPLLRIVAKIEVQLDFGNIDQLKDIFELTSVRLYNTNNNGLIVPFAENVENYKAKKASIPNDAVRNNSPILYTDFTNHIDGKATAMKGAIYLFETAVKDMDKPDEQTAIVVGGKFMNGAETFYRLDFFNENGDAYLDILRNHKYTFNITGVKGNGYATPEEAFEARPFNMTTEIFVTDENDVRDIVFNGQYMLGVNKSFFGISHAIYNVSTNSEDNLLKVVTDFPNGWTAKITTDQAGNNPMPANGWLTLSHYEGAGGAQANDVRIITTENTTETTRVAYIQLKAGLLSHTVVVVQEQPPIITLQPELLYFLYTATGQNPERISVVSKRADGTDAPNAEWTIKTDATWLTFGLQQNGSDKATTLSGTGSLSDIYVFVDRNNGASARQTEIYLVDIDSEDTKVFVVQDSDTGNDGYGTPPRNARTYVGAFWRANERGERLIRIEAGENADNYGDWTARVLWMDERWENGAIQLDTEMIDEAPLSGRGISFTADMNPDAVGSPENYLVKGRSASGNVSAANGVIFFRIGLNSPYTPTEAHPVRYAVVLLSYKNNTMHQKIFLRQGEAADYIMTNNDPVNVSNITGQGQLTRRTRVVKFSPYNLTADGFGTDFVTVSGRNGRLIDYPTKTGAFWLWGDSPTTGNRAYNPFSTTVTPPAAATTFHWNGATNAMATENENCPVGYRRPVDGSTTGSDSNPDLSNSEMRQSLWVRPKTNYNHNSIEADNSAWGFYADGFFDRRRIVLSTSAAINYPTAVAFRTPDIAHIGRLFFNPLPDSERYHASLFFPLTGTRFANNGNLLGGGNSGSYWTASSSIVSTVLGASALRIFESHVGMWNTEKNSMLPIRCARE
ncbi:MAG: DUF4906 domain-containing protein [Dysgonamonadaceae bacterium]|jgi:hypothetical protein|nr:DUF4906 domain-containing protein [Dysgonamonadaceae bacterium]